MQVFLLGFVLVFGVAALQPRHHKHWEALHHADPATRLQFTLALKHTNVATLEALFWEVSDPANSKYGNFLNVHEISSMIAPSEETTESVIQWITSSGVPQRDVDFAHNSKDFLRVRTDAATAEKMFSTKFCVYQSVVRRRIETVRVCPGLSYSLPEKVKKALDFVGGLDRFHPLRSLKVTTHTNVSATSGQNDPASIKKLYGVPPTLKPTAPNNSVAVAAFLKQFYADSDLAMFVKQYVPDLPGMKTISKVIGPNDQANSGLEASLDTQYIVAMSNGVPATFWSDDNKPTVPNQEPWVDWLAEVANTTVVPWVISISYGEGEDAGPADYMMRVNVEFMKLGLRGTSVLISTGDDGPGCTLNDPSIFDPNFPASSPYVTAVGGTEGVNFSPEEVWLHGSGGFSNTFPRPQYQAAAVAKYLKSDSLPPTRLWNFTGNTRAFPDVSAPANNVPICQFVCNIPLAGTSCAAPIFSGIISLVNDVRMNSGRKPFGFLNPVLYANPQVLNDVTVGMNKPDSACGKVGFPATVGWDAASGLGTPNYAQLCPICSRHFPIADLESHANTCLDEQEKTQPAKTETKKSSKKVIAASADDEKRSARLVRTPSQQVLLRIDRALENRMFLVSADVLSDTHRRYVVLGSVGNVYSVDIAHSPTCTCPDFLKGNLCKHIMFVLIRVLKVKRTSPFVYQRGLMTSELAAIFAAAPSTVAKSVKAKKAVTDAMSAARNPEEPEGMRNPDDDCSICCETMKASGELLACALCQNGIHAECFERWCQFSKSKLCPLCRGDFGAKKKKKKSSLGEEGYVNLGKLQGSSEARDTSTYREHYFERKRSRRYDDW